MNSLRIATWNLQRPIASQSARRERLVSWISKVNADIWVFTATHMDVSPGKGFTVVETTETDRSEEPGEAWTAIWSRFPIRRLGVTSDPARAAMALVEPPGRRPIIVYGTVLPWIGSSWGKFPASKGQAFAAALEVQTQDWTRLQSENRECALVVAGDLNQDLAEPHYYGSNANRAALNVALGFAELTCLSRGDDDPVRLKGAREHSTIDHLCASASLTAQAQWPLFSWPPGPVPDKSLTDHFGTGVDFNCA